MEYMNGIHECKKPLRDVDVDKRIIQKCTLNRRRDRVNAISLAQNIYQWPVFVKEIMNTRITYNAGNS